MLKKINDENRELKRQRKKRIVQAKTTSPFQKLQSKLIDEKLQVPKDKTTPSAQKYVKL